MPPICMPGMDICPMLPGSIAEWWRGEKILLLERMGVHPVGAAGADGKRVARDFSWPDQRHGVVGHAVHAPRWRQAKPMDHGPGIDLVDQIDVEGRARVEMDALRPVRLQ